MTDARVVRIESLAQGGDGLAREPGEPVVFVPDTAPGDLARIDVLPGGRDFRRARLVEVIEPGPGRRAPPCPEAGRCGGCQWQHLDDDAQDAAVRALLLDALRRIGRLETVDSHVAATQGPARRLAYRQRARFHLDLDASPPRLGFLRAASHDVHAMDRCPVLAPELEAVRGRIAGTLPELARLLPRTRAELSVDMPASDQAAALLEIVRGRAPHASLESALALLARAAPELVALEARIGGRHGSRGASVTRGAPRVGYQRGTVEEPARFPAFLSPGGFMQASRDGNLLLTSRVVEAVRQLALPAGARVLELFAGNGNLTLPLAALDLAVLAVDADPRAIANARLAAGNCAGELARVPAFEVGDATATATRLAREGWSCDLVVLDPPRTGAREACEAFASLGARAVVYVSCDAATLARDLALLARQGFELRRAEPLALFPQSAHFEAVAVAVRSGAA